MYQRIAILGLLALGACMPVGGLVPKVDTADQAASVLVLEPSSYDFGDVGVGITALGELTLRNDSEEAVQVASLAVEGEDFFLYSSPDLDAGLEPWASVGLTVAYAPNEEGMHGGVLVVSPTAGDPATAVLSGVGGVPSEVTDEATLDEPAVDLLFSADQSGSMSDDNATLAAVFAVFAESLQEITTDWQVMVANNDDGCSLGGVLTPDTPGYAEVFASDIQSGGGSYTEALLTVVARALKESGNGSCNDGFLRDEALLHVVLTSDEPEQSVDPLEALLASIQESKPAYQQARISAVAGDYPGGCNGASPGTGYYEAVQATEGAFLSICDSWRETVGVLAEASAWIWSVPLSAAPDVSTLVVTVEGTERAEGWHYDPDSNAVVFETEYPKPGQTVQVSYTTGSGS